MTYNGWTNYETWRINLELWDGYETDYPVTADIIQEMTEEYINPDDEDSIRVDYAFAFVNSVNWHEIANHINQNTWRNMDLADRVNLCDELGFSIFASRDSVSPF